MGLQIVEKSERFEPPLALTPAQGNFGETFRGRDITCLNENVTGLTKLGFQTIGSRRGPISVKNRGETRRYTLHLVLPSKTRVPYAICVLATSTINNRESWPIHTSSRRNKRTTTHPREQENVSELDVILIIVLLLLLLLSSH